MIWLILGQHQLCLTNLQFLISWWIGWNYKDVVVERFGWQRKKGKLSDWKFKCCTKTWTNTITISDSKVYQDNSISAQNYGLIFRVLINFSLEQKKLVRRTDLSKHERRVIKSLNSNSTVYRKHQPNNNFPHGRAIQRSFSHAAARSVF